MAFDLQEQPFSVEEQYRSLPQLYLGFLVAWSIASFLWVLHAWRNRRFEIMNKLQWTLASAPLTKVVQLCCSFLFWYSCMNFQVCSLWMSFGAYVTGVVFQTASSVCFVVISYGYCIISEKLSTSERRRTAALGLITYLVLAAYKASLPYIPVALMLIHLASLYLILHCVARNLASLREQLSWMEDDGHPMYDALQIKYTMFRKFQAAMLVLGVAQVVLQTGMVEMMEIYWFQIFVREWVQLWIYLYIGWTFRLGVMTSHFFVMPSIIKEGNRTLPPIHSIEMDATEFRKLSSQGWQVGVPTSFPSVNHAKCADHSLMVIVQHPHSAE